MWIKASERLPDEYGKVHWADANTNLPISAGVAYTTIKNNNPHLVLWLDESIPSISLSEVITLVETVNKFISNDKEFISMHHLKTVFQEFKQKYKI